MKKKGIALKTFIFTSVLITLIVVVSLGILYFTLPSYYFNEKSKLLQRNADLFEENLKKTSSQEECKNLISAFSLANNAFVMSYNRNEELIPELSSPFIMMGDTKSFKIIINAKDSKITANKRYLFTTPSKGSIGLNTKNAESIFLTKTIGTDLVGKVTITGTLQPIDEAKSVIISLMPYLLIIDILIALAAAYYYSRRLTKPILAISQAASEMQMLTPDAMSNVKSDDELGELSKNLDSMYISLCENIKNLQREMETVNKLEQSKADFMRAASHELKTPITALNGIVEGMIDNVGKYKDREAYLRQSKMLINKLSGLVNEILVASSLDKAENPVSQETINIAEVLDNALDEYSVLIEEKQLKTEINKADCFFDTDRNLLYHTLSNVISNAVKYTDAGGKIKISLLKESDSTVLSVENQCANIPEEELNKLFEPFYTLSYSRDRSRSGTGLGLYIVKKNLERLQIAYKLENTSIGLKFSLFFGQPADK